ncbi:polymeric immunoglobulin receptor-like [Synchiropus splendidus]|uniref:polymeric immunoglobulin receptor-like n=1 Tax=Synchiropus splendidus TaxID=270530 RepID=UPI00237D8B4D|nr:polymeric immunoglobulin receptor-like [Synchiropus splendidus]XP_053711559.1 polymeric immunoglobulin receptor-like [Synchiropus splendidus]XP_053711560.1 polymeric immunoglobulin receptor-like [Synchiropus splendidus]
MIITLILGEQKGQIHIGLHFERSLRNANTVTRERKKKLPTQPVQFQEASEEKKMRQSLKIIFGFITAACVRVLPATGNQPKTCSSGSVHVTGFVGLSVCIKCAYPPQMKNGVKEFCRVNGDECSNIISAYSSNTTRKDRFRLEDHKQQAHYRVTMSELTVDDSGKYLCRVNYGETHGCLTEVTLAVKKLDDVEPTVVPGVLGRSAAITCPYHDSHRDDDKCLCKGADPRTCDVQKIVPGREFKRSNYFRVVIRNLTKKDIDTYWCCSNTTWRHGVFQIKLSHSEHHQRKGKSDSSSSEVTDASEKREGSGTQSSDGRNIPKVISVVVGVLLVVTASVASVALYKLKLSRNTGRSAERQEHPPHSFKEHREDHQYEEISEPPCAQTPGRQLTTVYVTVNRPEENLQYASVHFQKNTDDKVE